MIINMALQCANKRHDYLQFSVASSGGAEE